MSSHAHDSGGSSPKLRIAFILPDLPLPPTRGYQVRALALADELRRVHTVEVVSAQTACSGSSAVPRRLEQLRGLFLMAKVGGPFQSALFDGVDVARRARSFCNDWQPHVTVIFTERLPMTTEAVPGHAVIIDVVDSMRLHMLERAARARPPLSWALTREAEAFKRWAPRLQARAAAVVCASSTALEDYPSATVIPNAAPLDLRARLSSDYDICFTGNLSYWPNVDAVRDICEKIVPAVRTRIPNVRVVVAGRNPSRRVRRACQDARIELLADVPDLSEVLRRTRVALAPIGWTPGRNLKIVEALAAGTPVLAYPEAVEQLPKPLSGAVLCTGPAEMAATCTAILAGLMPAPLPDRTAITWPVVGHRFVQLIEDVAAGRPATHADADL